MPRRAEFLLWLLSVTMNARAVKFRLKTCLVANRKHFRVGGSWKKLKHSLGGAMWSTRTSSLLLSVIIFTSIRTVAAHPPQAGPEGYLTTLNGQVMFIQLTQLRGRLSGQMQIVSVEGGYTKRTK